MPALLVTGARQVGKTTFLHNIAEQERRIVSLDVPDVQEAAGAKPRLFLADNPPPVAIDEIQYVPELLPYLKERIDETRLRYHEKAIGMYWQTGSLQFKMMTKVTVSLAGNIGIFNLRGLSARELHKFLIFRKGDKFSSRHKFISILRYIFNNLKLLGG